MFGNGMCLASSWCLGYSIVVEGYLPCFWCMNSWQRVARLSALLLVLGLVWSVGQHQALCTSRTHLDAVFTTHRLWYPPSELHDLDSVGANLTNVLILFVQFVHFHYYVRSGALRMLCLINWLRDWLRNPKSDDLCEDFEPKCRWGKPFQR